MSTTYRTGDLVLVRDENGKAVPLRSLAFKVDAKGVAVATTAGGSGTAAWADITGKPTEFPPEAHAHAISDVTGLQTALDGKQPLSAALTDTTASFTTALESKLGGIAAGATVGATWGSNVSGQPSVVGQAEAEAGTATTERIWTAQRVAQAIAALAGEGGGSPAGSSGQVQYNNAGAFGGASAVEVSSDGVLQLVAGSVPATPAG